MKAVVHRRYGGPDLLTFEEVGMPAPGDDQVLIAVRAASVNPLDRHFMRGAPVPMRLATGLRRPKDTRLGVDVAGRVEAVGRNVTRFKPGDEVFGATRGAFAEYACGPERALVLKPSSVTFEAAAAVPVAGLTALAAVRGRGRVQPGMKVLINGAAGGVGTFAVQIAKAAGAHVTGVCGATGVELVRSIGADAAVDYTREDFTRSSVRYDVMIDCAGSRSLRECRRVLNRRATYVGVGASDTGLFGLLVALLAVPVYSMFASQTFVLLMVKPANEAALSTLSDLIATGAVRSVIGRQYPLSDVPAAIRYLEEGHARGKIVISV